MSRLVLSPYRHLIGHQVAATLDREVAEAASNALATGGTITTDTPTSVVHEFTAGDTFALTSPGILPVTVTISATGTFGGLSASGAVDIYADQTVTVTSGTVEVAYDPTEFVAVSGLTAWYDASDETTISDTAGAVTAWADKSGNGFDLSATGGAEPTTGASTLNGLNVLDFAADWMVAASAADWKFLHDGTGEALVSIVIKFGSSANPDAAYGAWGTSAGSSNNVGASAQFDDRSSVSRNERYRITVSKGVGGNYVADSLSANGEIEPNGWIMFSALLDPGNPSAVQRSRSVVNRGRRDSVNTETNAAVTSDPTYPLAVGSLGNGSLPLTGSVAAMVVTTNLADQSNIEGYFVRRWGLPFVYAFDLGRNVTVASG